MTIKQENKYIYSEWALEMYSTLVKLETEITSIMEEKDEQGKISIVQILAYPYCWLIKKAIVCLKNDIANNPKKYSKGRYNSVSESNKALMNKYLEKASKELDKVK